MWEITWPWGGISEMVLNQLFCHFVTCLGQSPVNQDQTFGWAKVFMKQLLMRDFTILIPPPSIPTTKAKRAICLVKSVSEKVFFSSVTLEGNFSWEKIL